MPGPVSGNLWCRPWAEADAEAFFELSRDPGFTLHPITDYRQESLAAARAWVRDMAILHAHTGMGKWGVWEKSSGQLIGMGGLTPWTWEGEELVDITYRLRESAWGKGHGTELARALVSYAWELGLPEITATITPNNVGSKRIAQKLGMSFEKNILLLGVPTELYRLTRPGSARKS